MDPSTSLVPPLFLSTSSMPSTLNYFPFLKNTSFVSAIQTTCVPVDFAWNLLSLNLCLTGFALSSKIQLQTPKTQSIETHPCHTFLQHSALFSSGSFHSLKIISPLIWFSVCLFPGLSQNVGFRTQSSKCQICLRLLTSTTSAGISPNHPQFY